MAALRFITTNRGKAREVTQVLATVGVEVEQLDQPYPEVQDDDLRGVVTFALDWLAHREAGDLLIDDSGLFIHGLRGFPGVYSAYVFRTIGLPGTLRLLQGRQDRRAHFETVLGVVQGGKRHLLAGRCDGSIALAPRGEGGFGFDPIFILRGEDRTFAEMSTEEKNRISHRGRALKALVELLGGE